MSRFSVLVRHNAVLRLRDPGHLISYAVMPMVLMLVFKPLFAASVADGPTQAVLGLLVMFTVLALSIVGTAMLSERTWNTWDRLRATPVTAAELLAGKAVPVFAVLVLQQAVLLVFGHYVVGMPAPASPVLLGFAVLVWSLTLLAVGTAVATLVRSHGELSAVCDVGSLVVSSLGGALIPAAMLPGWAHTIAPFSPGYWAMAMLRGAVEGQSGDVFRAAAVLGGLAIVAGCVAVVRLERGLSRLRG
jgi:ABC-2 type transport system permease protein